MYLLSGTLSWPCLLTSRAVFGLGCAMGDYKSERPLSPIAGFLKNREISITRENNEIPDNL